MAEDNGATMASVTTNRRRRDLVELCVGYALILLVIWTPRPWQRLVYWAPVLWLLVGTWISFEGRGAMGLRTVNLLRSLWVVGVALGMAAIEVLVALHLGTLRVPPSAMLFFKTYIGYAVWSFVQQMLLVDFFLRRLLRLLPSKLYAVAVAGGIFALAHIPNPVLVPTTLIWGMAACWLFLRYRNLYPLGMAHAIFGICIAITVPGRFCHNMRVGVGYLSYRPYGDHRSHKDHIVSTHVLPDGSPARAAATSWRVYPLTKWREPRWSSRWPEAMNCLPRYGFGSERSISSTR